MKHEMNRNPRTWLLLVLLPILIVAAILAATWAASTFWYPRTPWQPPELPPYIPWDIEFFYIAKTVISTINAITLIFLIFVYIDIYRKTRSEFTVGLVIFSATLLLYALTSNPIVIRAFGFRLFGLGPFALLPDLFTLAALIVLLYLSIKY